MTEISRHSFRHIFRFLPVIFLLLVSGAGFSQGHLFSKVETNRQSVFVGEPVQVTVTVYTSTWFTKGINPGNIKVNGAFTVFFRSIPETQNFNGKTYAGVGMTFNVFPYDDEDITFPSLEIPVVTPDEGTSKGVDRVIKTQSRTIRVKPVPAGFDRNQWMVASNMTVKDSWIGNRSAVKVGEVLERKIVREVPGTVSELIPPVAWDSLSGVSMYPNRPEIENIKTKTTISATRSESIRYLFEKAGTVIIPEMVFTWWNPSQKKLFKRTLKSISLEVLPNPDLGMLDSIRDSLAVSVAEQAAADADAPLTFLGFSPKQFLMLLAGLIILIVVLIRTIRWATEKYRRWRQEYVRSEQYYFREFKSVCRQQNDRLKVQALYRWIDQLNLKEPTLRYFAEQYGGNELINEIERLAQYMNDGGSATIALNISHWATARNNFLIGKVSGEKRDMPLSVNP